MKSRWCAVFVASCSQMTPVSITRRVRLAGAGHGQPVGDRGAVPHVVQRTELGPARPGQRSSLGRATASKMRGAGPARRRRCGTGLPRLVGGARPRRTVAGPRRGGRWTRRAAAPGSRASPPRAATCRSRSATGTTARRRAARASSRSVSPAPWRASAQPQAQGHRRCRLSGRRRAALTSCALLRVRGLGHVWPQLDRPAKRSDQNHAAVDHDDLAGQVVRVRRREVERRAEDVLAGRHVAAQDAGRRSRPWPDRASPQSPMSIRSSSSFVHSGVSTTPGANALQVMLCSARPRAAAWVSALTANLLAQ